MSLLRKHLGGRCAAQLKCTLASHSSYAVQDIAAWRLSCLRYSQSTPRAAFIT